MPLASCLSPPFHHTRPRHAVGGEKKAIDEAAALGLALVCLGGLAAWGVDLRGWFERGIAALRSAGPWPFFLGLAFLPALGMPAIFFTLTAGPAFAGQLGTGAVVAAALAAMTANLILTYCLARWILRPWLARLLERLGYRLPELDSGDVTDLIVVLRVVPGVPYFAQNYLLGLADAPVVRYLLISCAVVWTYTAGIIVFGDALLHGKAARAMGAVAVLAVLMAAAHFARRHYHGRRRQREREA